jgi:predicted ABC-type ATPase
VAFGKLFKLIGKGKRGLPLGTIRDWDSAGKVQKTHHGWVRITRHPIHRARDVEPVWKQAGKAAKSGDIELSEPDESIPGGGNWVDHAPGLPKKTTWDHFSGYKQPKPERLPLHQRIMSAFLDKVPPVAPEKQPVAIMLMGGPASGKSSIARGLPANKFVRLDADAVKEYIPEYKVAVKWRAKDAAEMVHDESIHLMQEIRAKAIHDRKNLVMDGTGRHVDSYIRMISDLKKAGYHVKLVMTHLDKDIAKERAKVRASQTGRKVPDHVVDAAYHDVPRNFQPIAMFADDFEVWDTKGEQPKLVWSRNEGKETIHDQHFVDNFHAKYRPKLGPEHIHPTAFGGLAKSIGPVGPQLHGYEKGRGEEPKDEPEDEKEEALEVFANVFTEATQQVDSEPEHTADQYGPDVHADEFRQWVLNAFELDHAKMKDMPPKFKGDEGIKMPPNDDEVMDQAKHE